MLVSYVLRLVPSEAADGRIVGELEAVRSGEVSTVRGVHELVALIRADQHRADQNRADQNRADQNRPDAHRTVPMPTSTGEPS